MANKRSRELALVHHVGEISLTTPTDHVSPSDDNALLARWESSIKRAANAKRLGDFATEDLKQAARVRLWQKAPVAEQRGSRYTRKLIKRAILNELRHEYSSYAYSPEKTAPGKASRGAETDQQELDMHLAAPDQATTADAYGILEDVREWVCRLPERLHTVYHLLYEMGYTQSEAAEAMGVSQPRVTQLRADLLRLGRAEFLAAA
jgi:RNA polymerase sigma factor (sigma-70 family)